MSRGRQRGFSLLELLVTLLVIVLATSLVTLNIGSGNTDVQLESAIRQITDGAEYALDEAQFTGTDYGLLLREQVEDGTPRYAWAWLERDPEGWREPRGGQDVFAGGEFPGGLEVQLEIEEVIQSRDGLLGQAETAGPQIIFYASGETQPGSIEVRSADGALLWRIEWDLLGDFQALPRGQVDAEAEP